MTHILFAAQMKYLFKMMTRQPISHCKNFTAFYKSRSHVTILQRLQYRKREVPKHLLAPVSTCWQVVVSLPAGNYASTSHFQYSSHRLNFVFWQSQYHPPIRKWITSISVLQTTSLLYYMHSYVDNFSIHNLSWQLLLNYIV